MKSILFALCVMFSGVSQAALIQLNAERSAYEIGDTINVTLFINDFNETLGGFWSEIIYSPSAISLLNWQFADGFDDGFGSYSFAEHDAASGIIYFEDYADVLADEAILAIKQGRGFGLVTLSFLALQAGDVMLRFNPSEVGALNFANEFINVSFTDLNLTVSATQVPVPATVIMFMSGLALLFCRKQRKQ